MILELSQGGEIEGRTPQATIRKDFRDYPIVFGFILWWLYEIPHLIIVTSLKTGRKLFSFFSVDLLFRTLFLPWKRDEVDTTNMALDDKLRVYLMNLVSRLVGAVVRSFTILIGLLAISLTYILGVVSLVGFLGLPILGVLIIILSFI